MTATGHRTSPPSDLGADVGLDDEQLLAMYRMVALARAVDERMWILNRAGRIPFVISGQGHEGAQVGVTWALEKGHDWIAPFYRSIAMCMTFGMSARDIMLAQYARASDPSSGGRQMPGHYGDRRHNLLSVSSPVATQILHAVGIALAAKIRGTGQVALTAMGEGSSNQGDVHEALNFAAIHRLPFIFLVENNGYAISVPAVREISVIPTSRCGRPGTASRAWSWTAPTCWPAIAAAKTAVELARSGGGPTLIEAKVTRLTAHSSDDQQTKYRTEERPQGRQGPRRPAPFPGPAPDRRGADRRDRGDPPGRDRVDRDRRDRSCRGRAGSPSVHRDALGLCRGLAIGDSAAVGLWRWQ